MPDKRPKLHHQVSETSNHNIQNHTGVREVRGTNLQSPTVEFPTNLNITFDTSPPTPKLAIADLLMTRNQ